jgi:hypothetical protein
VPLRRCRMQGCGRSLRREGQVADCRVCRVRRTMWMRTPGNSSAMRTAAARQA